MEYILIKNEAEVHSMNLSNFMIRVSPEILEKIDKLISEGRYASRSDFAKNAISWYLNQAEAQENVAVAVRKVLTDGEVDEVLETKLRSIMKKVMSK